MPRKVHTKSRNGCVECKRRHIKCDETQPKCIKCTSSQRRCVFKPTIFVNRRQTLSNTPSAPSNASSPDLEPSLIATQADPSPSVNMLHMELFQSLCIENASFWRDYIGDNDFSISIVIEHALKSPYLMNELLAFAALHLCLVRPAQQKFYHFHATQLQTHAISQFNSEVIGLSAEKCVPMFLFSSFLGTHMLCQTLRFRESDPGTFLDSFVQYAQLHRGVRKVVGQTWDHLKQSPLGMSMKAHAHTLGSDATSPLYPAYAKLLEAIKKAKLGHAITGIYQRTIECLPASMSVDKRSVHHLSLSDIVAWPVLVPEEYLDFLMNRQPEALIILAHYAVSLYCRRDLWIFGDGGKFLIDTITKSLGPDWECWLLFPNTVLAEEVI
ncbi:hypothetical protein BDV36DRAFT_276204 [Aspergillus pseudocaelatus]|uniref:Zn(2)-C6 fungal-type domain-containing protein n=1 Tax=Aspergillus pseudocaelatus TaxID=1825620 RepID=A0ABQ6W1I3_9EURO|nr:hypothetical protein BDV36DRAFT_276204 [Aspergillus pseudocaelatus]